MPAKKGPTKEDLIRAEREIGENIPDEMIGLDDGDVRPDKETAEERSEEAAAGLAEGEEAPASRG